MQENSMWVLICTVNSSNTPRSAGSGHGTACRCHPGELDAILEAVAIEDFTVSATGLSISSTAQDQGSGHGDIICAGSGPGFDLVAQGEVGPGVTGSGRGEVFTQLGDGGGGAPGW